MFWRIYFQTVKPLVGVTVLCNKTNNLQAIVIAASDHEILTMLRRPTSFERGFRLLMQQYQERVYWQVRRMVDNHEDANDIVQNCFVKVYRNVHRFEGKSKLYTWIYRIATNEALTFLNRQKKHKATDIDDEETGLANRMKAEVTVSADDIRERLDRAISGLPDKQRLVFTLRYFEEMTYKDMAEILDTSVGALKASYHHAAKKIEETIRKQF
jgi:RNA polymerase sigma factor (sigma-70 family)